MDRERRDERRAESIVRLETVEDHLERAETNYQKHEAEIVDPETLREKAAAVLLHSGES